MTQLKMGKEPEQMFLQRSYKVLSVLSHQGNAHQSHGRPLQAHWDGDSKTMTAREDMVWRPSSSTEGVGWCSAVGAVCQFLSVPS